MKLFVVSFMIAVAAAETLENTYLPPSTSKTAGGNGDLLNARNGPSSKYGPPEYSNRNSKGQNSNNGNSQNTDAAAATLRFDNQNNGDGSYKFEFETENKIKHEESGELRNVGTEQEVTVVQGSYSYLGPDGVEYTVTYIADENGFQASGDHLPTSPPIPEEIQRSLEKNAADEAQEGYPSGPNSNQNYQDSQSIAYQRNQFVKESNQNDNESIIVESPENNVNNVQSQVYPTGKPPGRQPIPTTEEGKQYQPPQAPGRQYLTPNKPAFNAKTGYQY